MEYQKNFGKRKKMGSDEKEHEQKENTQNNQKPRYKKSQNILKDSCNFQKEKTDSTQYTYSQNQKEEQDIKTSTLWTISNDKQKSSNNCNDCKNDFQTYGNSGGNDNNRNRKNNSIKNINKNINLNSNNNNNNDKIVNSNNNNCIIGNNNNNRNNDDKIINSKCAVSSENTNKNNNNGDKNNGNENGLINCNDNNTNNGHRQNNSSYSTIQQNLLSDQQQLQQKKYCENIYGTLETGNNTFTTKNDSNLDISSKETLLPPPPPTMDKQYNRKTSDDMKYYSLSSSYNANYNEENTLLSQNKVKKNKTSKMTTFSESINPQNYSSGSQLMENAQNKKKSECSNSNSNSQRNKKRKPRKIKKSKLNMENMPITITSTNTSTNGTTNMNDIMNESPKYLIGESHSSSPINSASITNTEFSRQDNIVIPGSIMEFASSTTSPTSIIENNNQYSEQSSTPSNELFINNNSFTDVNINSINSETPITTSLAINPSNTPVDNNFANSPNFTINTTTTLITETPTSCNNSNTDINFNANTNTDATSKAIATTTTNTNTTSSDQTKVEYYQNSYQINKDTTENSQNYYVSTVNSNTSSDSKNQSLNSNLESLNPLNIPISSRSQQQPMYSTFNDNSSFAQLGISNGIPEYSRYPNDSSNVQGSFFNTSTNPAYSTSNVEPSNINTVDVDSSAKLPSTNLVSLSKTNDLTSTIPMMSNVTNSVTKPSNTNQTVLSIPSSSMNIRSNANNVQNIRNQQQNNQVSQSSSSIQLIGSNIQNNNQNDSRNDDKYSQSYIQSSPTIVLQNSNNFNSINTITSSSNNSSLSLNSNYIGVNYEQRKEIKQETGILLQQHQQQPSNISSLQLNKCQSSGTPIIFNNNRLSDSISINENQSTISQQYSPIFNNQQSNESLSLERGNKSDLKNSSFCSNDTLTNQYSSSFNNHSLENSKLAYDTSTNSISNTITTPSIINHPNSQQVISANSNNQIYFDGNNPENSCSSSTLTNYNPNQNITQNQSYNQQNQNYPSQIAQNYKMPYLYCPQNSRMADNANPSLKSENVDILTSSSYTSCIPTYKDQSIMNDPNSSSFISISNDKNIQNLEPKDVDGERREINEEEHRITLIPWEDKNTYVFQIKVGTKTLSRRLDNHTINGTKLLNIAGLTRGRRDGILKNERDRNVIKHGPLNLKGVWIPLSRARFITEKHKIDPAIYPILEDDPLKYLDKSSQYELEGIYEPYIRNKDIYATDDYIANKYSGECDCDCDCIIENCVPSNHISQSSHQEFNPYNITQYISNNSLKSNNPRIMNNLCNHSNNSVCSNCINSELPTENISQTSTQINNPVHQNSNDMNPCNLEYIIHEPEKEYIYNTAEHNYYEHSPQNHYQTDIRYDIPVQSYQPNISKPLKKNSNSAQSISHFSQIHPQLSSYPKYQIFDNGTCSNVDTSISYNNSMAKPIQDTSTYNNLSEYSTEQNASSLLYSTWINNSEYNGNEIQTINNGDYNRN